MTSAYSLVSGVSIIAALWSAAFWFWASVARLPKLSSRIQTGLGSGAITNDELVLVVAALSWQSRLNALAALGAVAVVLLQAALPLV